MLNYINMDFFKSSKGKFIKIDKNKKILLVALASILTLTSCVGPDVDKQLEETSKDVSLYNSINSATANDDKNYKDYYSNSSVTNNTNSVTTTNPTTTNPPVTEEVFNPTPIEKTKLDDEILNIIKTEVSLSDSSLQQFKSNVSNIDVNYLYSDLFGAGLALDRYNSIKEYNSKASVYIIDGKIDFVKNILFFDGILWNVLHTSQFPIF